MQPRPDKIRTRGRTTKTRLQLLRECKHLRHERQQRTQSNNTVEDADETDNFSPAISGHASTTSIPLNSTGDWAWLDLGLGGTSSGPSTNAANTNTRYSEQAPTTAGFNQSISPPDENDIGIGVALPFLESYSLEPHLDVWSTDLDPSQYPPSINDMALLDADLSNMTEIGPPQLDATPEAPFLSAQRPDSPTIEVKIAVSQGGSNALQTSPGDSNPKVNANSRDDIDWRAPGAHTLGRKFSRTSMLSVSSLRKRLSLKYSDSYLEEIQSLMQNLTIAGSSAISTKNRISKALSTTTSQLEAMQPLAVVDQMPSLDGSKKVLPRTRNTHPVLLPGSFPTFCWADINNNKLRPCRHGIEGSLRGPNCRPTSRETYRSMRSDVFSHILTRSLSSFVINEVDTFGNSGVHIAAACKHPSSLLVLKEERGWFQEPNNAGQTFLHLVQEPSPSNHKDLCRLLRWLSEIKFDFTARDHHGQTPLHLLTRPWLHGESVSKILEVLFASKIMIPACRDNLGYTIKEQIEQPSIGVDTVQVRRFFTVTTKSAPLENYGLPNFGKSTAIETVHDLVVYAQHAELLRDIRHSMNNPRHEDAGGRNGLHCLAEVCLDLPLPDDAVSSEAEETAGIPQTQRERYLQDLLKSSVDVNNHDKQGYTPLMAFIIHTRAGEDDILTTRLLQLLIDAKAGINTRDRRGETPLHLAVKLGRRAATKFLLGNGANVHARDGDGLGVIALGEAASKKAKHDEILYGQIMLCISLVVNAGGVSNPTILQEWGSPQWKIFD